MAAAGVIKINHSKAEGIQANPISYRRAATTQRWHLSVSSEGELFNVRALVQLRERGRSRRLHVYDQTGRQRGPKHRLHKRCRWVIAHKRSLFFFGFLGRIQFSMDLRRIDNRQDNEYSRLALNWGNERDRLIEYWNDKIKNISRTAIWPDRNSC
jgi:hypothetical protein